MLKELNHFRAQIYIKEFEVMPFNSNWDRRRKRDTNNKTLFNQVFLEKQNPKCK